MITQLVSDFHTLYIRAVPLAAPFCCICAVMVGVWVLTLRRGK